MNKREMKGIGGLVIILFVVISIAAVVPMATAVWDDTICVEGYKRDATGNGLVGWTITVTKISNGNGNGEPKSNTTDANGYWQICDLTEGTYEVTEVLQDDWTQLEPIGEKYTVVINKDEFEDENELPYSIYTRDPPGLLNFTNQPCGECDGKVNWLELKYNGTTENAFITVLQKDGVHVFDDIVQPGETFNFSGKDKWGTLGTEITIKVCSPIGELSMNGGVGCSPPQCVETKIHTSCSQPIGPGLIRGDFEVVAGTSRNGGWLCPLEEPPEEECGECDGKVNWLELTYNGTTPNAYITVFQKDGPKQITVFDGIVQPGGTFNFSGKDKWGTLGTEITIKVCSPVVKQSMSGGVGCPPPQEKCVETKIHTSCSQPIGPGLIRGDFEVVAGTSRNGGLLCPLEEPPEEECGECDGKVNWLELTYNGTTPNAHITVFQKDGKKVITVFDDIVQPGERFNFSGKDKQGTLGPEITIKVCSPVVKQSMSGGVGCPPPQCVETKIHTSCSQPIGPGLIRGDFEVVAGTSRNGGKLCPVA